MFATAVVNYHDRSLFSKAGSLGLCILGVVFCGKSKGGLTKGGLSPRFSKKIGGKSFLRNRAFSGQIGTFSGPIGAFSGPIGTNSSAPHSHGGRAEIAPKGPFLAQLAPFGPSPPLLSPPLDFPDLSPFFRTNVGLGEWSSYTCECRATL